MRFIHLTDLHCTDPIIKSYFSKRALGLFSWKKRRRFQHDNRFLKLLIQNVLGERPDLVVITGDVVQVGTKMEIQSAKFFLSELFNETPLMIVPGNHDNYAHDSFDYIAKYWKEFIQITPEFPSVRVFDKLVLVGLMSGKPMPFWSAEGELGVAQLERLKDILAESNGKVVCLFMHHPPYSEGVSKRKSLRMSDELRDLLLGKKIALICHGHLHRNVEFFGMAPTRVFCTASASACSGANPASYRIFDVNSSSDGVEIEATLKQLDPNSDCINVIDKKSWSNWV